MLLGGHWCWGTEKSEGDRWKVRLVVVRNSYCQSLLLFMWYLMLLPLCGLGEQVGTIMWSHIPASPAPERHLCTAAVGETGSSLWLGLPCVYCGRGRDAPMLGSGSYKGQSWWLFLRGAEHETMAWMALWVGPETPAYSRPVQRTCLRHAPGLWWRRGWSAMSWWHLQTVGSRTEQWDPGQDPVH